MTLSAFPVNIAIRWMPHDLTEHKSTLVQVMAWCRKATSHYLSQCWPRPMSPYGVSRPQWVVSSDLLLFMYENILLILNSSDAADGIFQLWGSIPCLLMRWLLKSPGHQQTWYWLCKTDNMCCCSRVNFVCLGQAKSKIRFKMCLYLF